MAKLSPNAYFTILRAGYFSANGFKGIDWKAWSTIAPFLAAELRKDDEKRLLVRCHLKFMRDSNHFKDNERELVSEYDKIRNWFGVKPVAHLLRRTEDLVQIGKRQVALDEFMKDLILPKIWKTASDVQRKALGKWYEDAVRDLKDPNWCEPGKLVDNARLLEDILPENLYPLISETVVKGLDEKLDQGLSKIQDTRLRLKKWDKTKTQLEAFNMNIDLVPRAHLKRLKSRIALFEGRHADALDLLKESALGTEISKPTVQEILDLWYVSLSHRAKQKLTNQQQKAFDQDIISYGEAVSTRVAEISAQDPLAKLVLGYVGSLYRGMPGLQNGLGSSHISPQGNLSGKAVAHLVKMLFLDDYRNEKLNASTSFYPLLESTYSKKELPKDQQIKHWLLLHHSGVHLNTAAFKNVLLGMKDEAEFCLRDRELIRLSFLLGDDSLFHFVLGRAWKKDDKKATEFLWTLAKALCLDHRSLLALRDRSGLMMDRLVLDAILNPSGKSAFARIWKVWNSKKDDVNLQACLHRLKTRSLTAPWGKTTDVQRRNRYQHLFEQELIYFKKSKLISDNRFAINALFASIARQKPGNHFVQFDWYKIRRENLENALGTFDRFEPVDAKMAGPDSNSLLLYSVQLRNLILSNRIGTDELKKRLSRLRMVTVPSLSKRQVQEKGFVKIECDAIVWLSDALDGKYESSLKDALKAWKGSRVSLTRKEYAQICATLWFFSNRQLKENSSNLKTTLVDLVNKWIASGGDLDYQGVDALMQKWSRYGYGVNSSKTIPGLFSQICG